MREITYLAVPYTWNPDLAFKVANIASAALMQDGWIIFSPISHSYPVADFLPSELRTDQEFWMNQDLPMLERCSRMVVVELIGDIDGKKLIEQSKGCQTEISKAKEIGIPCKFMKIHTSKL